MSGAGIFRPPLLDWLGHSPSLLQLGNRLHRLRVVLPTVRDGYCVVRREPSCGPERFVPLPLPPGHIARSAGGRQVLGLVVRAVAINMVNLDYVLAPATPVENLRTPLAPVWSVTNRVEQDNAVLVCHSPLPGHDVPGLVDVFVFATLAGGDS